MIFWFLLLLFGFLFMGFDFFLYLILSTIGFMILMSFKPEWFD